MTNTDGHRKTNGEKNPTKLKATQSYIYRKTERNIHTERETQEYIQMGPDLSPSSSSASN